MYDAESHCQMTMACCIEVNRSTLGRKPVWARRWPADQVAIGSPDATCQVLEHGDQDPSVSCRGETSLL